MAQDVERHCKEGTVCQQTKPTMSTRVQITNVPIGRPWQMIAQNILEVTVSSNNNRYLLVVQDYFTKWADARPLPDQAASRITTELMDPFITYGIPEIVHSVTLRQPVRDTLNLPPPAYASGEYGKTLHAKLAEFTNLVVVYMAEAAEEHRQQYNKHSEERFFEVDDPVWLSIPTAGMWDPRWEGNWVVTGCKSPVNVHISEENQGGSLQWQAPQCNHKIHDVMLTEKHQPEDLPVLVPAEDHVAEYPEEGQPCLLQSLKNFFQMAPQTEGPVVVVMWWEVTVVVPGICDGVGTSKPDHEPGRYQLAYVLHFNISEQGKSAYVVVKTCTISVGAKLLHNSSRALWNASPTPLGCSYCPFANSICSSLRHVMNLLAAGKIPQQLSIDLARGNLPALSNNMPVCHPDVGPIAVDNRAGLCYKGSDIGGNKKTAQLAIQVGKTVALHSLVCAANLEANLEKQHQQQLHSLPDLSGDVMDASRAAALPPSPQPYQPVPSLTNQSPALPASPQPYLPVPSLTIQSSVVNENISRVCFLVDMPKSTTCSSLG
ncbi:hypothetical protein EMCRGX_G018917 [Ephydatia muelleri]